MHKPYKKTNPLDKVIPNDFKKSQGDPPPVHNKVVAKNWKKKSQVIQSNIKKDVDNGKPFVDAVKDNAEPSILAPGNTIQNGVVTLPPPGPVPGTKTKSGVIRKAIATTFEKLAASTSPEEAQARFDLLHVETIKVLDEVGLKNVEETVQLQTAKFLLPFFHGVKADPNTQANNQQPGNQFAIFIQPAGTVPESPAVNITPIKEE